MQPSTESECALTNDSRNLRRIAINLRVQVKRDIEIKRGNRKAKELLATVVIMIRSRVYKRREKMLEGRRRITCTTAKKESGV
jgi:hypothetical protein